MKEIRIKVEDNMSKQDEIEVLEKLRNIFEAYPNNYLKSLFTNNFVTWITKQIKNDFPPDAYEHFCGFNCQLRDEELKKASSRILNLKAVIIEHKTMDNLKREKIVRLKEVYNQLERQFEELLNETSDTEYALRGTIKELENVIINLKAKLYDKQTKEE